MIRGEDTVRGSLSFLRRPQLSQTSPLELTLPLSGYDWSVGVDDSLCRVVGESPSVGAGVTSDGLGWLCGAGGEDVLGWLHGTGGRTA